MKKLLVVLSLLAFVAVVAVPTTIAQDTKAKTVVVDKKVSKKASKAKHAEAAAAGSCCEAEKGAKEGGKSCAATCTEAAACKGMAEKKK